MHSKQKFPFLTKEYRQALEGTGLKKSDPRLKEMVKNLEGLQQRIADQKGENIDEISIGRKEFKELIFENIVLISRALRHQFIIPEFSTFTKYIDEFYDNVSNREIEGKCADYIPQLARLDPELFGVAICTVDGQRYSIGDSTEPFTLQSCWQVFFVICIFR